MGREKVRGRKEGGRKGERQSDRDRDRQRDRETEREREGEETEGWGGRRSRFPCADSCVSFHSTALMALFYKAAKLFVVS